MHPAKKEKCESCQLAKILEQIIELNKDLARPKLNEKLKKLSQIPHYQLN